MRRRWLAGLLALLAAACGDNGSNPAAGDLLVSYDQIGPEPGAVLLSITGGPVSTVTAVGATQVTFASPVAGTTKVVVLGTFVSGDLLRIHVPDVSLVGDYRVRLEQVADKTSFALIDASLYTFGVHK